VEPLGKLGRGKDRYGCETLGKTGNDRQGWKRINREVWNGGVCREMKEKVGK
jgi:hypothetical protein